MKIKMKSHFTLGVLCYTDEVVLMRIEMTGDWFELPISESETKYMDSTEFCFLWFGLDSLISFVFGGPLYLISIYVVDIVMLISFHFSLLVPCGNKSGEQGISIQPTCNT